MKNKLQPYSERIKDLRLERGLTQVQLAKATGTSQATLARWETGERTPSMENLIALAKFFGESIDYLVGRID